MTTGFLLYNEDGVAQARFLLKVISTLFAAGHPGGRLFKLVLLCFGFCEPSWGSQMDAKYAIEI